MKRITAINIDAPNIRAIKYVIQALTDLKAELDTDAITAGNSCACIQQWIDGPDRK